MTIFQAAAMGIIQGLTEFLPVSSSAHLILAPRVFGWDDPGLAFDVALHLGTLAGVLAYFRKDLWTLANQAFLNKDNQASSARSLILAIALATMPGGIAGLLLEHKVESIFRSPALIAGTLIAIGFLMAIADRFGKGEKGLPQLTLRDAMLIGLAQCLALIPGVSRSGITISTALFLGFERTSAARFSFLLSIPIIAGAGLLKSPQIFHAHDPMLIVAGFLASAVSGLGAIWILMKFIEQYRFTPYVIYRLVLGVAILLNLSRLG